jgi:hypothetical protein
MEPGMKTIFDSSFKYTPSRETDVRKTFDRIRREQRANTARRTTGSTADAKVNVRSSPVFAGNS